MGEQEDKIFEFFMQSSTILGILAFLSIAFNIFVPDVKVDAILSVAAILLAFHQYAKDTKDAVSLVAWVLQPTTLRALVLSISVLVNWGLPTVTIDKIISGAGLLLMLIEIFRNELTARLVFRKE